MLCALFSPIISDFHGINIICNNHRTMDRLKMKLPVIKWNLRVYLIIIVHF